MNESRQQQILAGQSSIAQKIFAYKPVHRGGQVYAITATFKQTFHP